MENLSPLAQQMIKAVARSVRRGHTYVPTMGLVKAVRGEHTDGELVNALHEAIDEGHLIKTPLANGSSVIYQPAMYQMEKSVARRLNIMAETPIIRPVQATVANTNLSDEQAAAVQGCLAHNLSVLTGGPGTGKTTTLKAVIDSADASGLLVMLCAPTGQAAKRMGMATGREATTIHRMLGYNPEDKTFACNRDNLLVADFVVVDESSMLDLWLLHSLLVALPERTRLLFVGDVDQLPSVGAGNVLNDIIASGIGYVARLTKTFRQGDGSCIIANAKAIRDGVMPVLDNKNRDFFMFSVEADKAGEMVADIVANRIPNTFGLKPEEIQVLSPTYKGEAGVDAINTRLQKQFNGDSSWYINHKSGLFKVGDRIIQTKNNYDDGVMNGEVGHITFIDKKNRTVSIQFDDSKVTYRYNQLWQIKLAYAITIHRSQGSEYRAVVIPVVEGMSMMQRNLLYTAVTRAKQLVVLVGSESAIQDAVQDVRATERWTALVERIQM